MLKLSFDRLPELFSAINEQGSLYMPVRQSGQVNYTRWEAGLEYCHDALNTVTSVKSLFFPQSEDLAAFRIKGKNIEVIADEEPEGPFTVFGVRACDARAMDILDMVFLSEPADSFYEEKRKSGTVITMACNEPEESCFCGAFQVDAASPGGDVSTWYIDGYLYWQPMTDKGKVLTETLGKLLCEAETDDEENLSQHQVVIHDILSMLPLAGVNPDSLGENDDLFGSDKWEELSSACLGCGSCTFICPTCQCYDIRDFNTGREIRRFRCWDSCMYSDFTLMAHGNPRTTQMQRFRQRFMHKLAYFPENNDGAYSCVGCGRCVAKCPISMNIAKVINVLGGQEND